MRWCASQELKRATGEIKRKPVQELAYFKSFRNQLKDSGYKWLNFLNFLGIYKPKRD